ncbi:MAG: hypothetical protein KG003_06575 [Bacteroidetes bacterium]|nr:hypothetical protein [Bacteroidota bacterium]
MKKFFGLTALFLFFYPAQTQQVTKEFNRMLVDDDFSRLSGKWDQQSNSENVFVGLDRGFQTWRKNSKSGFFLLPQQAMQFSVFEAYVNFTFDSKGNKNQSAGIVLQAQADGSGALVVEVNKKKQFRILRAVNNRMIAVSGQGEGWVKNKKAITSGENMILIRTYDKIYDLFINGIFVISFTEIEYSKGQIGLYIGAQSKVVFHRLTVKTDDDHVNSEGPKNGNPDEEKTLSQVIVKLKETINKKDKRIADLEAEVRSLAGRNVADTTVVRQKQDLENRLLVCNREMESAKSEREYLQTKLKSLEDFKQLIRENENGDIIINLSNLTASQKAQIESLQSEIKSKTSSMEQLKGEKEDLEKALQKRYVELGNLQNEKVDVLQRMIEKDSIIQVLEEKNKLLDEAYQQCRRSTPTFKEPKPKKEGRRRKKQNDNVLFDE